MHLQISAPDLSMPFCTVLKRKFGNAQQYLRVAEDPEPKERYVRSLFSGFQECQLLCCHMSWAHRRVCAAVSERYNGEGFEPSWTAAARLLCYFNKDEQGDGCIALDPSYGSFAGRGPQPVANLQY